MSVTTNFQVVCSMPIVDNYDAIRGSRIITLGEFDRLDDAMTLLDAIGSVYGEQDYDPYSAVHYISRDGYHYANDVWTVFAPDTSLPTWAFGSWSDGIPF